MDETRSRGIRKERQTVGKDEAICRDERKKSCSSSRGKGEAVNVGTDHLREEKRNKGSGARAEGADVMSLRKVTRKGQTRKGNKGIPPKETTTKRRPRK